MALADTHGAIGAVGELLRSQLTARTSVGTVQVGRPEDAVGTAGPKFNLFLFQVGIDGFLRNEPLDAGQQPPLWLVLHYLLTAIDTGQESDSTDAHRLLGEGMSALQGLSPIIEPAAPALVDNPEPLRITFDDADVDLLSKVMQGSEEHYRVSVAFQVRPVMIVPGDTPSLAPLVLSVGQPEAEGVMVLPTLGPHLDSLQPTALEAGASLTVFGDDLGSAVDQICLGDTCYGVTAAPAGQLQTVIPADTTLSPGSHAVTARRTLPSGHPLVSNALLVHLLPSVVDAVPGVLTDEGGGLFSGAITVSGTHLGGPDDTLYIAFWRNGVVPLMLEATGSVDQTTATATVTADEPLAAGVYRVLLRVNGVQAPVAPEVDWS